MIRNIDVVMDSYKFLHFASIKNILNWSVQYADEGDLGFTRKFPMAKIGSFLVKSRDIVDVQDNVEYTQVTLKINNGGVVPRNNGKTVKGLKIGTKRQYVIHAGQFIMSKIDARNGAYGIVPEELEGAIVTNDFPVFDVDAKKIIPQFLVLVSTANPFIEFARKCSSGTTNRKRIDIEAFLNQKIPLPSIEEQEKIIKEYKYAIIEAEKKESKARLLENKIEEYILSKLEVTTKNKSYDTKSALYTTHFSDLDRWDVYNAMNLFSASYMKSPYPIVSIGKAFVFPTRTWKKKEPVFQYVEIGNVDSLLGIVNAEEFETSDAPSRATQIIKEGDLIIGLTRPYLKKFAIVNKKFDGCVCSSGFQIVAPSKEANVEFLYEYLKSSIAVTQFEFYMTGALYPAITAKDLKKILVPLPPIDVQNSIVAHIHELKEQIKLLKQQSSDFYGKALKDFETELYESI